MKLNNKGFALTSIIYMLIVLFLMVILLILANLAQRKVVLDKMKYDIKSKLNQGVAVNSSELPYFNETTGIYYETLVQALSNAQGSGENIIKVQKNIEDQSASNPTLALGKNVTLDIQNYIVTLSTTIKNNGTMTVRGSGTGKITSSNTTIENNGTFTAQTGLEINSSISNHSTINNTKNFTLDGATVTSDNHRGIINSDAAAKITMNSGVIISKQYAIYNSSGTGNTTSSPAIKITGGTVESAENNTIYNNATGMIYLTGGTIKQGNISSVINNVGGGIIQVSGATIEHTATNGSAISSTGGSIIITDGNISTTGGITTGGTDPDSTKSRHAVYTTGTFTMSGGTITSGYSSAVSVSGSSLTVSGGTIQKGLDPNGTNHTGPTLAYSGTGTATLSGGTIKTTGGGSATAYKSGSSGNFIINGATVQNLGTGYAVQNNSAGSTIKINSGTVTSETNKAVYNSLAGTIEINGGSITSNAQDTVGNASTGKIKMTGGTVISNAKAAFTISNGTLEITGGTATGATYGVYLHATNSTTFTLGTDDTTVTSTINSLPKIQGGSTWGVAVNSGTFNFYDGVVIGPTSKSISKPAVGRPDNYDIVKTNANGTETAVLGPLRTITYDYNYFDDDIYGTKLVTANFSAATSTGTTTKVDNNLAKYGKEARWTVTSNDTNGGPHLNPGRLTVGSTYTWSVYLKASKNMKLNVGQEQGGRKQVDITTEWQRITYTFTATDTQYNSFTFYAVGGSKWNTGDTLYVHSIELKEVPTLNITTDTKPTGAQLGTLPAPTRTNYTFDGWYTSPAGGTAISSSTTVPNSNVTYYAHWIYAP